MILFDEEDKNDLSISKGDAIWAWGHNPTFFNISSIDTFRPPQHQHMLPIFFKGRKVQIGAFVEKRMLL